MWTIWKIMDSFENYGQFGKIWTILKNMDNFKKMDNFEKMDNLEKMDNFE